MLKILKRLKKFPKSPQKKEETPQLNHVFKSTESPQTFCGKTWKEIRNTLKRSLFTFQKLRRGLVGPGPPVIRPCVSAVYNLHMCRIKLQFFSTFWSRFHISLFAKICNLQFLSFSSVSVSPAFPISISCFSCSSSVSI